MSENSKYSFFMDEIISLEKEVHSFLQKHEFMKKEKEELDDELLKVQKENEILKLKNKELEEKLRELAFQGTSLFGSDSLNLEDKEQLKSRINELITKLDYHLRS
jgi:chromosome segregation ATPase